MFVVFEENSQFKAEKILTEADTTLQVESASGKRSKIKRNNVLFTFNDREPEGMVQEAQVIAQDIDVQFLWEICPNEDFSVEQLAIEYFGEKPSSLNKMALLLRLHENPVYFHRKGKGNYRAAPEEILNAALAALEKKQKQAEQQQAWTDSMVAGVAPEEIAAQLPSFLGRPDKNTMAWKAFEKAMEATGKNVAELLLTLKIFPHELALHRYAFLSQHFPKGTVAPEIPVPEHEELETAPVEAYSIDDISTTEIDDAFSIQAISEHEYIIGIHIACPALVVERDTDLDKAARQRMSTVYTPGEKIPMQSEQLIERFSLNEGRLNPCLSFYVRANIDTGEILERQSKLEQVFIKENLRSNNLDALVTLEALEDPQADLPYAELLRPMWRLSTHLRRARDEFRGKPEQLDRIEYLFSLDGQPDDPDATVILTPRRRNAPLDLLVAEFMVLVNSEWAKLLDEYGLPGIFRSQQFGRVRMSTHAQSHDAIGVSHYMWSTSPLRRYVDLINQGQLIAAIKHGVSARLVAPFKPRDADLFAIISGFESQYTLWSEYQSNMERYWCLRWFEHNQAKQVNATLIRDDLVRCDNAPFITTVNGMPELERGDKVELELHEPDLLNLTLICRYVRTLSEAEE